MKDKGFNASQYYQHACSTITPPEFSIETSNNNKYIKKLLSYKQKNRPWYKAGMNPFVRP